MESGIEELEVGLGRVLEPVPTGVVIFTDTIATIEDGDETPVDSRILEFDVGDGKVFDPVPTAIVEFSVRKILEEAMTPVDRGTEELDDGVGTGPDAVPVPNVELADAKDTI